MTILVAWLGVDSRGPASMYLASDSRITWDKAGSWDGGRKLFACHARSIFFGYCGEAFFPSQILGQVAEQIDAGLLGLAEADGTVDQVLSAVSKGLRHRLLAVSGSFAVIIGLRCGDGMSATFHLHQALFSHSGLQEHARCDMPAHSGVIGAWGSGAESFREHERRWSKSDVGGTSRSVFSAFADSLASGRDPKSGPPPQLVVLYRKGPSRPLGLVWQGRRYYYAVEVTDPVETHDVRWHNSLFEISDPKTLERLMGAQPQPRPKQVPEPPRHERPG